MAFELLATPEPLLKPGHYLAMIGEWGDKYPKYTGKNHAFYYVTWRETLLRDYYKGIMPASPSPSTPVTIDPDDDCKLHPQYYSSIYQARIGLSPGWLAYIRWPTNEYRMPLEEPGYAPVPTDADKRYIGFIDSKQSPIVDDPFASHPIAMRFEFIFVKDWMPEFHAWVNDIADYVKLIMRFFVARLNISRVANEALISRLEAGDIPFKRVFHYSEYVKRGAGVIGPGV